MTSPANPAFAPRLSGGAHAELDGVSSQGRRVEVRNYRPAGATAPMQYRRFGKTERALSVVTLGGMRFVDGWGGTRREPTEAMVDQCKAVLGRALGEGINHIETAYGYGRSEHCYGRAFAELGVPRDRYFLMSKGAPKTGDDVQRLLDEQLEGLGTDHLDLYAWHGLNTAELARSALANNGPVRKLIELREQGVLGAVGFSTHAPVDVISGAIESGLFDFVNLHYYYFFQRNWAAVELAQLRDMGVFIISPNDKGGRLFEAPERLRQLTAPLTPIQWNARFCLRTPAVHTLSFGMTEMSHFDEMSGLLPADAPLGAADLTILRRMDAQLDVDPFATYEGHEFSGDPSGINVAEILRFRRMWKCYDMSAFARYRYNMLEGDGHWVPGHFATPERLAQLEWKRAPAHVPVREMLAEFHEHFFAEKKARLSES